MHGVDYQLNNVHLFKSNHVQLVQHPLIMIQNTKQIINVPKLWKISKTHHTFIIVSFNLLNINSKSTTLCFQQCSSTRLMNILHSIQPGFNVTHQILFVFNHDEFMILAEFDTFLLKVLNISDKSTHYQIVVFVPQNVK